MTLSDLELLCARVTMGSVFRGASVRVERQPTSFVLLHASVRVPCVETRKRITVMHTRSIPLNLLRSMREADAMEAVRELFVELVAHEVSEALMVDCRRIFDPHKPRRQVAA